MKALLCRRIFQWNHTGEMLPCWLITTRTTRESNPEYIKHDTINRDLQFSATSFPVYSHDILIHGGRLTHICVGNLTIMASDNSLSPDRRQAIIGTNARMLLNGSLGTNDSNSYIFIQESAFKKVVCKMATILSPVQRVPNHRNAAFN